jgi:hypothetical protein
MYKKMCKSKQCVKTLVIPSVMLHYLVVGMTTGCLTCSVFLFLFVVLILGLLMLGSCCAEKVLFIDLLGGDGEVI